LNTSFNTRHSPFIIRHFYVWSTPTLYARSAGA
jgi:hypothetical protein